MYLYPSEKMEISLRPAEAKATGLPCYKTWDEVPEGLLTKTRCIKVKKPIGKDEKPVAYVLCRYWLGYLPLYDRREDKDE